MSRALTMSEAVNERFLSLPTSAILFSLILHVAIPLTFLTVGVLDNFGIHLFPKSRKIRDAFQSYVQVDIVGLPEMPIKDNVFIDPSIPVVDKPAFPSEKPAAEEQSEKIQQNSKNKSETDELTLPDKAKKERLAQAEQALKKLRDEVNREKALKALAMAKGAKEGRSKIAGNIVSKGTATKGKIGSEREIYESQLISAIKQHFDIYTWQGRKKLESGVAVQLLATGKIKYKKVIKPSSDPHFDSAVLKAIDAAQPLPLPTDLDLREEVLRDGVEIGFRPEEQ
ncbi:MAG: cell envelope integrity protein TolA [Deltaproteobacteria bacterium]|nr:cell envelope integrity protein TolA [Deltaproteobacteria bacterium]